MNQLSANIAKILEQDNTFFPTETIETQSEKIVMKLANCKEGEIVAFSPNRYGIVTMFDGKKVITIYRKNHNFNIDEVVEQFDWPSE